jgi:hypothetical protein
VAVAAVVSGVRGGGDDDSPAAPTAAATTAKAPVTTGEEFPVGDLRRLAPPAAGTYDGDLLLFDALSCEPTKIALATLAVAPTPAPASCVVWSSPGGASFAHVGPPDLEEVWVGSSPEEPGTDTGLTFSPGTRNGALTVTDDGTVAVCDGERVRVSHDGRVQTLRTFTNDGQFDERCITGALGASVIQLAADRRSLVDLRTRKVVRRLAERVEQPLVGLVASSDGLVTAIDINDGTPSGVVFGADGGVLVPRQPLGTSSRFRKLLLARGGGAIAMLTSRGWQVTNLTTGLNISTPGGAQITDVAFAARGDEFAATTQVGVLLAAVPGLEPKALLPGRYQALVWLP